MLAAPSAAGIALSVAERTAGKRLQESKQTIPHFYLQTSVNAAAMIARRKAAEPAKLAWDAFFVSAVAKAIANFDRFRCRLDGERLVPIDSDAIGVAVDVEGELYVIPDRRADDEDGRADFGGDSRKASSGCAAIRSRGEPARR